MTRTRSPGFSVGSIEPAGDEERLEEEGLDEERQDEGHQDQPGQLAEEPRGPGSALAGRWAFGSALGLGERSSVSRSSVFTAQGTGWGASSLSRADLQRRPRRPCRSPRPSRRSRSPRRSTEPRGDLRRSRGGAAVDPDPRALARGRRPRRSGRAGRCAAIPPGSSRCSATSAGAERGDAERRRAGRADRGSHGSIARRRCPACPAPGSSGSRRPANRFTPTRSAAYPVAARCGSARGCRACVTSPALEHDDAIGERQRVDRVVRDEDAGAVERGRCARMQRRRSSARRGTSTAASGSSSSSRRGSVDQGPRQRDPLRSPPGEVARRRRRGSTVGREVGEELPRALAGASALRPPPGAQRERDVLEGRRAAGTAAVLEARRPTGRRSAGSVHRRARRRARSSRSVERRRAPASASTSVDLPAPFGPSEREGLAVVAPRATPATLERIPIDRSSARRAIDAHRAPRAGHRSRSATSTRQRDRDEDEREGGCAAPGSVWRAW